MIKALITLFFAFYISNSPAEITIDSKDFINGVSESATKAEAYKREMDAARYKAMKEEGSSSSGGGGFSYFTCSYINDMHLKRFCETGSCTDLVGFRNGKYQNLCTNQKSYTMPPGENLNYYMARYLDHGLYDEYDLENKVGISRKALKSFWKVQSEPALRTMLVIFWLNGITFSGD